MSKIICVVIVFLSALSVTGFAQSNKSQLEDKIVIIVHMQEAEEKDMNSVESTTIINKINGILEDIEADNVIYSKAAHKILNITLTKIYVDKIILDLDSRLNMVNQNIFTDDNGDIFSSVELNEYIKERDIKQVVLVGQMAEGCIKKSALSGKKMGYEVYIIPEAIKGESLESKTKVFNKLEKKGVHILKM